MKIELDQAPPTHFDFMIFWDNLPIFFKILLPFTYVLAIISMFTELPTLIFANYAIKSLEHGQVWRILTAPYVSLGMLHYTICMINLYYVLPRLQKTYSTIFIIVDFFIQNLIIQCIFSLVLGIAYDFSSYVQDCYSAGLWNILILYLIRVCYSQPKSQIQMCCMPFKLRTVYYPFLMLIIYNIFTLPLVQLDIYIAFVWSMLQTKCANGNFFKYPPACLEYLERKLIMILGARADITKLSDSKYREYYEGKDIANLQNGPQSAFNTIKQNIATQQIKGPSTEEHIHNMQCDHTL